MGNNPNSTTVKPSYTFKYNNIILPSRFSYAIDWWGYYNGSVNNKSLAPTIRRDDPEMPNRNVNPSFSQAGLLTEYKFPTGGYTAFEFESNRGINDKPIVNSYDNTSNGGVHMRIDGINIIPSKKVNLSLENNGTVIETYDKIIYDIPFTLDGNVIGTYNGFLYGSNTMTKNVLIKVNGWSNSCNYGLDSLPFSDSCSIYFRIEKDGVILYNKLLTGSYDGS
jgi:hypothetical protein